MEKKNENSFFEEGKDPSSRLAQELYRAAHIEASGYRCDSGIGVFLEEMAQQLEELRVEAALRNRKFNLEVN